MVRTLPCLLSAAPFEADEASVFVLEDSEKDFVRVAEALGDARGGELSDCFSFAEFAVGPEEITEALERGRDAERSVSSERGMGASRAAALVLKPLRTSAVAISC